MEKITFETVFFENGHVVNTYRTEQSFGHIEKGQMVKLNGWKNPLEVNEITHEVEDYIPSGTGKMIITHRTKIFLEAQDAV